MPAKKHWVVYYGRDWKRWPEHFGRRQAAIRCVDRKMRGLGPFRVRHNKTGELWKRLGGAWFKTEERPEKMKGTPTICLNCRSGAIQRRGREATTPGWYCADCGWSQDAPT